MTKSTTNEVPSEAPTWNNPKVRECLRCRSAFQSEWSGERVCSRCKNSNAWRSGAPFTSRPAGDGR